MTRRPGVVIDTRPIWRLRLGARVARALLGAVVVFGVLATARTTISPPRAIVVSGPASDPPDRGAEALASLFARRYLTWNAADPSSYQQGLAQFTGNGSDPSAGFTVPAAGEQRVQWVEVVQARAGGPGAHVYTVAAQTDTAGLVYLSVRVLRGSDGRLALLGPPAFVGSPALAPAADPDARRRPVEDPSLLVVASRALRNYLADSASDLAADLTASARVSLPALPLALSRMATLRWLPDGRSMSAVVIATDARGATYTLGYELDVVRADSRWEIGAIQMDPNT